MYTILEFIWDIEVHRDAIKVRNTTCYCPFEINEITICGIFTSTMYQHFMIIGNTKDVLVVQNEQIHSVFGTEDINIDTFRTHSSF